MKQIGAQSMKRVFYSTIAVVLAITLAVPQYSYAEPTSADKHAEAQAALASLNTLQASLAEAENNHWLALEEQNEAQAKMDDAQARIDEANAQIAACQDKLGSRVRTMYRSGNTSFLDILLGAASFEDFVSSLDILNQMNQSDADLVQQTKDLSAEIELQKQEFTAQEKIAAEKAEQARIIKEEAESTVAAMQATYDSLSAEAAALLEQERAAQAAIEAAQAQAVLDAANAAAAAEAGNSGGGGYDEGGSSGGGFVPDYNPVTGNAVVDRAYGCLGAPYVWGGVGPNGFDCSGLVSYALSGSYTRLGTTYTFLGWNRVSDPQPGDIAVNSGHTGIYIGGGQMIHAATYGVGVIIGPVQSGMVFVRY